MKSISVPIELLEDMLNPCADFATHERLRALIDDPEKDYVLINGMHFSHAEILEWREKACAYMEKAAQPQGGPVGFRYRTNNGPWEWMDESPFSDGRHRYKQGFEEFEPLFAEQPEPVAVADFYEAFRFSEIVTDDQAGELAEIAARLNGVNK